VFGNCVRVIEQIGAEFGSLSSGRTRSGAYAPRRLPLTAGIRLAALAARPAPGPLLLTGVEALPSRACVATASSRPAAADFNTVVRAGVLTEVPGRGTRCAVGIRWTTCPAASGIATGVAAGVAHFATLAGKLSVGIAETHVLRSGTAAGCGAAGLRPSAARSCLTYHRSAVGAGGSSRPIRASGPGRPTATGRAAGASRAARPSLPSRPGRHRSTRSGRSIARHASGAPLSATIFAAA
jgi:hypothetical protein